MVEALQLPKRLELANDKFERKSQWKGIDCVSL